MIKVGTRLQVMRGIAKQTGGGLKKKDLKYNKHGKIVSKKISDKIMKGGYIISSIIVDGIRKSCTFYDIKHNKHNKHNKYNRIGLYLDNQYNIKIIFESKNKGKDTERTITITNPLLTENRNTRNTIKIKVNNVNEYNIQFKSDTDFREFTSQYTSLLNEITKFYIRLNHLKRKHGNYVYPITNYKYGEGNIGINLYEQGTLFLHVSRETLNSDSVIARIIKYKSSDTNKVNSLVTNNHNVNFKLDELTNFEIQKSNKFDIFIINEDNELIIHLYSSLHKQLEIKKYLVLSISFMREEYKRSFENDFSNKKKT